MKLCDKCGGKLRVGAYRHTERVGPFTAYEDGPHRMRCERCGGATLSCSELKGYELRAAQTVLVQASEVGGEVLRYARKSMGLRQEELADALGVAAETVSRWETGAAPIDRTLRLGAATLVASVLAGRSIAPEQHKRRKFDVIWPMVGGAPRNT